MRWIILLLVMMMGCVSAPPDTTDLKVTEGEVGEQEYLGSGFGVFTYTYKGQEYLVFTNKSGGIHAIEVKEQEE